MAHLSTSLQPQGFSFFIRLTLVMDSGIQPQNQTSKLVWIHILTIFDDFFFKVILDFN